MAESRKSNLIRNVLFSFAGFSEVVSRAAGIGFIYSGCG